MKEIDTSKGSVRAPETGFPSPAGQGCTSPREPSVIIKILIFLLTAGIGHGFDAYLLAITLALRFWETRLLGDFVPRSHLSKQGPSRNLGHRAHNIRAGQYLRLL